MDTLPFSLGERTCCYRISSTMKLSSALLLISLGSTYPQMSQAASAFSKKVEDDLFISIGKKDSELLDSYLLNGPMVLLWKTTGDWSDDEYFVEVKDGSSQANLYRSGQHSSNTNDISPKLTSPSFLYDIVLRCDLENFFGASCDGTFSWVAIDCGCPAEKPIKVQDCTFASMATATPANCRDLETSKAEIIGEWISTGLSGSFISSEVTHGTTITDSTAVTNEQASSFTTTISAGIDFKGISATVQLSATESSSIAQQVETSLSATVGTKTIMVSCPDPSLSSSGLWFIWQWAMQQEADGNGPGFSSATSDFVCTESNQQPPRCPLLFCADIKCQSCDPPFENLGAPAPALAPVPTALPTPLPIFLSTLTTTPSTTPVPVPAPVPMPAPQGPPIGPECLTNNDCPGRETCNSEGNCMATPEPTPSPVFGVITPYPAETNFTDPPEHSPTDFPTRASPPVVECRRHEDYFCDKTLDEIFIVGTHNSLALPGKVFSPNQNHGLKRQYTDGIRLFTFDLKGADGEVYTAHGGDAWQYNPEGEIKEVIEELRKDKESFLVVQLEDKMDKNSRDTFLGWLGNLVVKDFDINTPLGEYMRKGQHVLILTDKFDNVDAQKGVHHTNFFIAENDYQWKSCYFHSSSMGFRRGKKAGTAKLMNYFCSLTGTGDIIASDNINRKHRILYSARKFVKQDYAENKINMILVDYYEEGDVFGAQAKIRASDLKDGCWQDGKICGKGTTCWECCEDSSYWYSKAFTACGSEPKWSDGAICALGTTCNACKNKATYWWGKAFTACGSEPKWADGTRCLAGTSCNACRNGYEWWDSKFGHHCGKEPCWTIGTVCGVGTTCNNCCGGANCPWYQFGVCTCK